MHGERFDDILDGYFPLSVSVADLMRRRGMKSVVLELRFAPILSVEGLAPEAPVPLNIRSGRAGLIELAALSVDATDGSVRISGQMRWRWLDGAEVPPQFDPMTRLAEPAYVTGMMAGTGAKAAPDRIMTLPDTVNGR